MIKIDMWYGNKIEEADKIDISFNDLSASYSGYIFKNGKIIGDYVCNDSLELERTFYWLKFNWD